MDFYPKKNEDGRLKRNSQGKRFRTPEEFVKMVTDKGHPLCKVFIYNRKERLVIEALKDMKTKHTHIMKARRPTNVEEKDFEATITREKILTAKTRGEQLEIVIAGDDWKKELKSKK